MTDTTSTPSNAPAAVPAPRKATSWRRSDHPNLNLIGLGLIVAWLAFWVQCFFEFSFVTDRLWVPRWVFLSLDYQHVHLGVKAWHEGLDPFSVYIDFRGRYAAPPITLLLFRWTRFFDPYVGALIWDVIITATFAYTVLTCLKVREQLRLWVPPVALAIAVFLWSTPAMFSIERGNLDVWVLLTLFIALNLMRRGKGKWYCEVVAGLVLAIGAWAKMYSGLFILALLPFKRWTAAATCVVGIVLIGVIPLRETKLFFRNAGDMVTDERVTPVKQVVEWLSHPTFAPYAGRPIDPVWYGHSLTTFFPLMFSKTPLGSVPGLLVSALLFGPLWLYAAWCVYRSPRRESLFLPFILWTMALGTYALPNSYDYNLFFMLLTALCLWDRRDSVFVHLLMLATVVIWWQPFYIGIDRVLLIWLKMLAIIPVSVLMIRHARRPDVPAQQLADARQHPWPALA